MSSIELHHLFLIFPIRETLLKYLTQYDWEALSSVGGEYQSFYLEFNRELNLDQYDDKICSKFKKIEKLTLTNVTQTERVPQEKLSVLVSLEVYSLDKNIIDLKECIRLETLSCKTIGQLDKEDFPSSLKRLTCYYSINGETINNFPVSLERIDLSVCENISDFDISHLVILKEIDCSLSGVTNSAINNFPVSLERIDLSGCRNISDFNINHLVNLKEKSHQQ
uniref:Leucine-rich repeat domain-containing protein n=1 Tax=Cacopsylla melanoneura TaxID=428564 RepID=A0A8D9EJ82_9HEMI